MILHELSLPSCESLARTIPEHPPHYYFLLSHALSPAIEIAYRSHLRFNRPSDRQCIFFSGEFVLFSVIAYSGTMDLELQQFPNAHGNPRSSRESPSPSWRRSHDANVNSPGRGRREQALEEGEPDGQQLPPTDRGLGAWRMLFAACIFEALLWGRYLYEPVRAI